MLSGAATGFVSMLLTRLGLGVGEAPTFPVSYRAVRDWGPYTERGLAVGCIQAGTLLGPALSAPLVAWLIAATSWRVSFFVTGAVGLVWVVVWLALVSTPEETRWIPEPERRRILAERHAGEALPEGGVGYRGLLRSPSMWGLAISQGLRGIYGVSIPELAAQLPADRPGLSMVNSGLFTSVPFFVGAAVIIAHQPDRRPDAHAADHARGRAAQCRGHVPAARARVGMRDPVRRFARRSSSC